MAQQTTYTVDYIINVVNANGVKTIADWQAALNKLGGSIKMLDRLNKRITTLNKAFHNKSWKLTLNTADAERKISSLETRVAALRKSLAGMTGGAGGRGGRGGRGGGIPAAGAMPRQFIKYGGSLYSRGQQMPSSKGLGKGYQWSKSSIPVQAFNTRELATYNRLLAQQAKIQNSLRRGQATGQTGTAWYRNQQAKLGRVNNNIGRLTSGYVATHYGTNIPAPFGTGGRGGGGMCGGGMRYRATPGNLGYKLFGPTPLTNDGGMAISMLKGMGIAYGIAGIGQFFSEIINSSADYDNIMQTVENILKSHDKKGGFDRRFSAMSNTIRQVGIQTKFKVTEVADAAKFLAMAGLSVDDINSAIKPIANIALVGDTELGETADLVTNVMTAYNMEAHQMRKASDIMTNTFTMTNTTLPEIAESYKYAASLLSAGGIGFEEATAAIGILGDAGIKGSQAGTTMRTILNNIINPRGKYRKQAWEATGIKKFDDNGQVRSLAEIFTELADKNLSVEQYYKLFDKTAAQGAVALATHVQKWNEVIKENFMSQGLAQELADKKKNTIKGLWAAMTSSITDDGVIAFQGVEGEIKTLIRNATEWIRLDSTKSLMNSLFKDFMDFIGIIKDSLKYFYDFYTMFRPIIGWLVRVQLYMWPVIKTFTLLKTTFLALMGVTRLAAGIRALAVAFSGLSAAVGGRAAWRIALANLGGYVMSGGQTPLLPWTSGNVVASKGATGYNYSTTGGQGVVYYQNGQPMIPANPNRSVKPPRTGPRIGAGWSNFGRGAAAAGFTVAGSMLGYGIGNAIDSDNGGTWGSVIGGVAGAGASAWAMSGFAGAGALLTNPIGWGILVAGALTAVGVHIFNRMKDIEKANEATRKWKESFDHLHVSSIDLTEENGLLIAYMRTFNNTLLDERSQLEESIETFNRYWAAKQGPEAVKDEGSVAENPGGKEFKQWLERADWNTGKYSAFEPMFKALGGTVSTSNTGLTDWTLGGYKFASTNYASLNEDEATRVALAQLGASNKAPLEDAERAIMKAVLTSKDAAWIEQRFADIKKQYLPAISDEFSNDLSSEEVMKWSMPELMQSKWFQATWAPRLNTAFANWQAFRNAMTQFDAGTPLQAEAMQDALKPLFGPLFDRGKFGLIGTPQWYEKVKDAQTHWSNYGLTQEAAQNLVSSTFEQLVQTYNMLDDHYKPMFGGFLDRSIWNGALSGKESLPSGGFMPGASVGSKAKDSSGNVYTWSQLSAPYSLGTYGWVDKNGNQYYPDTAKGSLTLLNSGGGQMIMNDQYLANIAFASRFASQYAANGTTPGPVAPNNATAYNQLMWPQSNTRAGWANFFANPYGFNNNNFAYNWNSNPFIPNINTNGYATSTMLAQAQKPAQPKVEVSGGVVRIDHLTIENYEQKMTVPQFTNLLTQTINNASRTGSGLFNLG